MLGCNRNTGRKCRIMKIIRVLDKSGGESELDRDEFLAHLDTLTDDVDTPFSETSTQILGALSKRLLTSTEGRSEPQLIALGYWLRPAALATLVQHAVTSGETVRVARGMAYQLPPQNVDTLFVYSWALSFLVGNSNVTRLPSRMSPLVSWLILQIAQCLDEGGQSARQLFCTFDYHSEVSAEISSLADLRVVWGGDAKVRVVSADPTRPDGITVAFSDRKSICLINGTIYEKLSSEERTAVAERFFNDVFWFDQMGCGSPRVVVWLEENGPRNHDFLSRVSRVALARNHLTETGTDISKFVFANLVLSTGTGARATRLSPAITAISADISSELLEEVHGGGLLFESSISQLADIMPLVRRDLQTVTTFGIDHEAKIALAHLMKGRGGYRIVPIGEALHFEAVWDGIDLIQQFSRLIVVR